MIWNFEKETERRVHEVFCCSFVCRNGWMRTWKSRAKQNPQIIPCWLSRISKLNKANWIVNCSTCWIRPSITFQSQRSMKQVRITCSLRLQSRDLHVLLDQYGAYPTSLVKRRCIHAANRVSCDFQNFIVGRLFHLNGVTVLSLVYKRES